MRRRPQCEHVDVCTEHDRCRGGRRTVARSDLPVELPREVEAGDDDAPGGASGLALLPFEKGRPLPSMAILSRF